MVSVTDGECVLVGGICVKSLLTGLTDYCATLSTMLCCKNKLYDQLAETRSQLLNMNLEMKGKNEVGSCIYRTIHVM